MGLEELRRLAKELRLDELEERRILVPLLLRRVVELEAENTRLINERHRLGPDDSSEDFSGGTRGNLAFVRAVAAVRNAARALRDWEQTRLEGDDPSVQAEWEDELNALIDIERRARDEFIRRLAALDFGNAQP
jgi:hypothetical protein